AEQVEVVRVRLERDHLAARADEAAGEGREIADVGADVDEGHPWPQRAPQERRLGRLILPIDEDRPTDPFIPQVDPKPQPIDGDRRERATDRREDSRPMATASPRLRTGDAPPDRRSRVPQRLAEGPRQHAPIGPSDRVHCDRVHFRGPIQSAEKIGDPARRYAENSLESDGSRVTSQWSLGVMTPSRPSKLASDPTSVTSNSSTCSIMSNCGPLGLLAATRRW